MTGYKENQLIHIEHIGAFQDNYIWFIHNDQNSIFVDPGDAKSVVSAFERKKLNLVAIFITLPLDEDIASDSTRKGECSHGESSAADKGE